MAYGQAIGAVQVNSRGFHGRLHTNGSWQEAEPSKGRGKTFSERYERLARKAVQFVKEHPGATKKQLEKALGEKVGDVVRLADAMNRIEITFVDEGQKEYRVYCGWKQYDAKAEEMKDDET